MYEPVANLALLVAPRGGRVRGPAGGHPLLARIFPDDAFGDEADVAVRIGMRPGGRGGPTGPRLRRYALLPRPERVRLAVSLDDARAFRSGIATYRPGRALNRALIAIARRLGPVAFAGATLEIEGAGVVEAPAERAARLLDDEARIAALFLGSPGATNTAMLRLLGPAACGFAKLAAGPAAGAYVEAEGARLDSFAAAPLARARVPRVLGRGRIDDMFVLVLADAVDAGARQVGPDGSEVIDLLVELNTRERATGTIVESTLGRRVARRLGARADPDLAAGWRRVCECLGETPLPLGLAHGDFVPWNLLRDRDGLVALDWEWSAEGMPPGIDLAHFLFQGAINLNRPTPRAGAQGAPFKRYLARLEISSDLAEPLFLAYLIDWILFETVIGEKPPDALAAHRAALARALGAPAG